MGVTDFDTKLAVIVRDDLAVWQRLNVAAFLVSGITAQAGAEASNTSTGWTSRGR